MTLKQSWWYTIDTSTFSQHHIRFSVSWRNSALIIMLASFQLLHIISLHWPLITSINHRSLHTRCIYIFSFNLRQAPWTVKIIGPSSLNLPQGHNDFSSNHIPCSACTFLHQLCHSNSKTHPHILNYLIHTLNNSHLTWSLSSLFALTSLTQRGHIQSTYIVIFSLGRIPQHFLFTHSLQCIHKIKFLPTPSRQTLHGSLPTFSTIPAPSRHH